ncbi:LAFA_0D14290g1_1 [Lachancea sp. 'fantastica']|nr:LAFA_0D14290g1_1 [Lachancea sp. 'fantastica']
MFNSRGSTTSDPQVKSTTSDGRYHEKTIEDSLKELERFFGTDTRSLQISKDLVSLDLDYACGVPLSYGLSNSQISTAASSGVSSTLNSSSATTNSRDHHTPFLSRQFLQLKVPDKSRFFVIKSNSADHIQTSILNGVWSSTELGNKRLSQAFRSLDASAQIFLLYSVNGSGCFCGLAEMVSDLRNPSHDFWTDSKRFKHIFSVRWILTQEIPNNKVKHFSNPLNEMKSVIQSRDTQEIPLNIARSLLQIYEDHINSR